MVLTRQRIYVRIYLYMIYVSVLFCVFVTTLIESRQNTQIATCFSACLEASNLFVRFFLLRPAAPRRTQIQDSRPCPPKVRRHRSCKAWWWRRAQSQIFHMCKARWTFALCTCSTRRWRMRSTIKMRKQSRCRVGDLDVVWLGPTCDRKTPGARSHAWWPLVPRASKHAGYI